MKKIALCGFYGKNNFGDDLMAEKLSAILSANKTNEVKIYSDTDSTKVLNASENNSHLDNDHIVIGGGGIVSSSMWFFKNHKIKELIDSHKPVTFLNVNVVNYNINPEFLNNLKLLNADWWVRDKNSVEILKQNGITANYLPDVSFHKDTLTQKVYDEYATKKVITVFLNGHALTDEAQNLSVDGYILSQYVIRAIARYLDWLSTFGWEVHIIPCQVNCATDDRISGGILYSLMQNKEKVFWITRKLNSKTIIRKIENSHLVLSMRFHPTVLAAASGRRFLDLTHHAKNRKFLADIDLFESSLEHDSISVQKLIDSTISVENDKNYSGKIEAYTSDAKQRWQEFENNWKELTKGT